MRKNEEKAGVEPPIGTLSKLARQIEPLPSLAEDANILCSTRSRSQSGAARDRSERFGLQPGPVERPRQNSPSSRDLEMSVGGSPSSTHDSLPVPSFQHKVYCILHDMKLTTGGRSKRPRLGPLRAAPPSRLLLNFVFRNVPSPRGMFRQQTELRQKRMAHGRRRAASFLQLPDVDQVWSANHPG